MYRIHSTKQTWRYSCYLFKVAVMTLRRTAIKDDVGTKATTNGIHLTFQVLFFAKNVNFVTSCRHGTVHLAYIVVLEFCLHSTTIRQYHICGMSFWLFSDYSTSLQSCSAGGCCPTGRWICKCFTYMEFCIVYSNLAHFENT